MSNKKKCLILIIYGIVLSLMALLCFSINSMANSNDDYYIIQDVETEYTYKLATTGTKYTTSYVVNSYACIQCDKECVAFYDGRHIGFMTTNDLVYMSYKHIGMGDSSNMGEIADSYSGGSVFTDSNGKSIGLTYFSSVVYGNINETQQEVLFNDIKIFKDKQSAVDYLSYGSLDGLSNAPMKEYDNEQVCFESFKMTMHSSNVFDQIYFEFDYVPTEYLIENKGKVNLAYSYSLDANVMMGTFDVNDIAFSGALDIDLSVFPNEFIVYLKDITPSSFGHMRQQYMLGDSAVIMDSNEVTDLILKVTKSALQFELSPYIETTYGKRYDAYADILNPKNSCYDEIPYNPDTGTYVPDNAPTIPEGYYNTLVGVDGFGNPTYTYTYIDNSTNTVTNITNPDSSGDGGGDGGNTTVEGSTIENNNNPTNTNNNNPTFNNTPTFNNDVNVTVEGDEINNDVDNIVNGDTGGSKEDNDSFINKVMGFFNPLINNSFILALGSLVGWLPAEVLTLITGALGISVGIAVWRFFRK